MNERIIPKLKPQSRSWEYNSYNEPLRDRVVYEYLFNSKSHRSLDEIVLGNNPQESSGYQSMNILHYLGLKSQHKGIFQEIDIFDAIERMKGLNEDGFSLVIQALERYSIQRNTQKLYNLNSTDEEEEEYPEGKEAYRIHRYKERDPKLIRDAKALFLKKHGFLFCEVCKINFEVVYGERGKDFIEAHHTKPISKMKEGEKTNLEDISMLCSNCHRMIHRSPFITVEQLRGIIAKPK